ncbi:MAG: nucleotidyltransferase family protein [Pontiellaceae bacterium]|nr:nucleotidyltransferase family protein [Pontiellaceae bacterium]MBN2786263.1 nucleotidyltransferase family protein [Pontiellaceae bacterium]
MKTSGKVNAVILAGDRRASIKVRDDNKGFIELRRRPLFIHVLQALKEAELVGDIVVVGPKERVLAALEQHGIDGVRVVEQRASMIENFKAGYVSALGLGDEVEFWSLKGTQYEQVPVLVAPCDIPLLVPEEVDEFVRRSNMHDYDYSIGVSSEQVLSHYYPSEGNPGIRMIYFHVRECLMRHNNLHIGKPLTFSHLDYIEKMYEWRYQTRFLNIVHVLFSALAHGWRFAKGLRIFIMMQLSLFYDRHGHPRLATVVRSGAGFNRLAEGIGNAIGARVQIVYTHFGGAVLDADNEKDLATIEARYDEWMEYQHNLFS